MLFVASSLNMMNPGAKATAAGGAVIDSSASPVSRFSCNICLDDVTEPVVTQCGHLYCWPCLYQWLEPGLLPGERQSLTGGDLQAKSVDESKRICPVCKAPCSVATIVPIYAVVETSPSLLVQQERPEKSPKRPPETLAADDSFKFNNASPSHTERETNSSPPDNAQIAHNSMVRNFRRRRLTVPSRPAHHIPNHRRVNEETSSAVWITTPLVTTNAANTHPLGPGIASQFYQALTELPASAIRDHDADATAFLSRLLLLLGSFVILCLLLF